MNILCGSIAAKTVKIHSVDGSPLLKIHTIFVQHAHKIAIFAANFQ